MVMKMCNKLKAAVYCRVSTEKTDQKESLENQIEYFYGFIEKSQEYELYKIYADDAVLQQHFKHSFNVLHAEIYWKLALVNKCYEDSSS